MVFFIFGLAATGFRTGSQGKIFVQRDVMTFAFNCPT